MAPALLTNDKLADKKGKQSSKQNKRKMDPESHTQEELSKDRKNNSDSQEIVKQNKIAAVVNHLAEKTVSNGTKKAKSKKSKKNSLNGEVSEEVDMSSQKKIEETLPEIKTTEDSSKLAEQTKNEADLNSGPGKTAETNNLTDSTGKSRKRKNRKQIVNEDSEVKASKVSKKDITKPDAKPDVMVDFTSLKLKLSSEDEFISTLLTNIPSQSVSIPSKQDSDDSSAEMEETETDQPNNRAANPEELQLRLTAKLNQFQGINGIRNFSWYFIYFILTQARNWTFLRRKWNPNLRRNWTN